MVAQVPGGWLAAPGLCCTFNMHPSHCGAPDNLVSPERPFIATLACIVLFRPGGADLVCNIQTLPWAVKTTTTVYFVASVPLSNLLRDDFLTGRHIVGGIFQQCRLSDMHRLFLRQQVRPCCRVKSMCFSASF